MCRHGSFLSPVRNCSPLSGRFMLDERLPAPSKSPTELFLHYEFLMALEMPYQLWLKRSNKGNLRTFFSNLFVEFCFAYSISRYKVRPERHSLYGMLISLGSTLAQRLSGGLCLAKPSAVSIGNVEVSISSKGQGE